MTNGDKQTTQHQLDNPTAAHSENTSTSAHHVFELLAFRCTRRTNLINDNKMKSFSVIMFSILMAMLLLAITTVSSDDIRKDEKQLNRLARASGKDTGCHYDKTPWSPCDEKTNVKTRTLTLKKGDETCEKTKKIEKKCKKACRYMKGSWSQCNSHNEMIRTDTLKDPSTENSNCEKTRQITKKCKNKGRGNKGNKQNRSRQ